MPDSIIPNGSNRFPLTRGPDPDPPELRVLLLSIPDEHARNLARSWFYQTMQGDASSPCVQLGGIISILMYAAAQPKQFDASPNGQGKSELETLARTIKALPGHDHVASKQDLKALQQQVSQVAEAVQKSDQARQNQVPDLRTVTEDLQFAARTIKKKLNAPVQGTPDTPLMKWGKRAALAAVASLIAFGAGYLICSNNLRSEMDARVDRVINAQPAAASVPLFVASRGGAEKIGPIKGPNGETKGIIIEPGELGKPFISTTGAAVVPIP